MKPILFHLLTRHELVQVLYCLNANLVGYLGYYPLAPTSALMHQLVDERPCIPFWDEPILGFFLLFLSLLHLAPIFKKLDTYLHYQQPYLPPTIVTFFLFLFPLFFLSLLTRMHLLPLSLSSSRSNAFNYPSFSLCFFSY